MKNLSILLCFLFTTVGAIAQINKEELALKVSKADQINESKLTDYIWKRHSRVFVDNQVAITTITEFSFDATGKLQTKKIDSQSNVEQKPGLRGAAQQNAMEEKKEYVQKALKLALDYAFMSKGELVDFFDKATVSEKDGLIEAVASNVKVAGDKLLVKIDPATNLFVYKEFTSILGADAIDGKLSYDKFSNGTVHGTTTILNLPVQKMRIEGINQDYTIRVK